MGTKTIDGISYNFGSTRINYDNWYEIGGGFYECYGRDTKNYGSLTTE